MHLESPESLAKRSILLFASLLGVSEKEFQIVSTGSSSLDVEYRGIELGSYGMRDVPDCNTFVYGTRIAEPRFSQATLKNKLDN